MWDRDSQVPHVKDKSEDLKYTQTQSKRFQKVNDTEGDDVFSPQHDGLGASSIENL